MKDNKVPIYTADVIIEICSRKTHKVLKTVSKTNVVCKGFTISQIKKTLQDKLEGNILKTKTARKDKYTRITEVSLLRQHGYGVNEFIKSQG